MSARLVVGVAWAITTTVFVGSPVATAADVLPMSITIPGRVRDFTATHPDFVPPAVGDDRKMVRGELGFDGKPVYALDPPGHSATTTGGERFDEWFRDV